MIPAIRPATAAGRLVVGVPVALLAGGNWPLVGGSAVVPPVVPIEGAAAAATAPTATAAPSAVGATAWTFWPSRNRCRSARRSSAEP